MLKKSTVNKQPPNIKDASGGKKGIPANPPQAPARTGGSTNGVLAEAKPAKHSKSYMAPRKEHTDGLELGYTKVG